MEKYLYYVFNILYWLFVKIFDLYETSNIAWHMKKYLQGTIWYSQLLCFGKVSLFRGLRNEVNKLLDKETRMWFRRSRALWAIHGDKNSKYFHSRATQRFRKNKIDGIKNASGEWCSNPRQVATKMLNFFSNLFSSTNTCQPEVALDCAVHSCRGDEQGIAIRIYKKWSSSGS